MTEPGLNTDHKTKQLNYNYKDYNIFSNLKKKLMLTDNTACPFKITINNEETEHVTNVNNFAS